MTYHDCLPKLPDYYLIGHFVQIEETKGFAGILKSLEAYKTLELIDAQTAYDTTGLSGYQIEWDIDHEGYAENRGYILHRVDINNEDEDNEDTYKDHNDKNE